MKEREGSAFKMSGGVFIPRWDVLGSPRLVRADVVSWFHV
jgi:hypothetical protein